MKGLPLSISFWKGRRATFGHHALAWTGCKKDGRHPPRLALIGKIYGTKACRCIPYIEIGEIKGGRLKKTSHYEKLV